MSEPITGDLIPGRWYRIVAISEDDPNPTMKADDIVECAEERGGCIDPGNICGEWFADYQGDGNGFGTIVGQVEEVARPAQ